MSDSKTELKFIIVGASVSGLASAIGLKNVGHNVLVLERDLQLGGIGSVPYRSGCAQIPPNGCKILLDWGLAAEAKANSAPLEGFSLYKYADGYIPSPDHLGINRWDPELLAEARGGYMQISHPTLMRILYNAALKPSDEGGSAAGVSILFGAEVINVDCDACSVTLRSGKKYTGDAIIGADGVNGMVRRTLLQHENESPERETSTGIAAYSAIVPNSVALENNLGFFYNSPGSTLWAGPNRGLRTFPVGKENDIWLLLYTPDNSQDGTWTKEAEKKITDVLGCCDEHVQRIAALAGPATCVQIKEHCNLESWVSESGKVLVLGDAAHPFPPGAVHSYAVALEDGAFIGKIFSHTRNRDRVPEFLRAFQEYREPRCSRIRKMEKEYIYYITLPDGELQATRDASIRARHAAGHNVLDGDLQQMMDDFRMVFGYEPTDDADEWWMTWGRYRDLEASPGTQDGLFNMTFSSVNSGVEISQDL